MIGMQFGRWVIIGDAARQGGKRCVLCTCKCGTERVVRVDHLQSGRSKGMGYRGRALTADMSHRKAPMGSRMTDKPAALSASGAETRREPQEALIFYLLNIACLSEEDAERHADGMLAYLEKQNIKMSHPADTDGERALRHTLQERLSAARMESDGGAWVSAELLVRTLAALSGERPAAPTPEGLQEWADWFDQERQLYVVIKDLPRDGRLPAHGLLRTIARELAFADEERGR